MSPGQQVLADTAEMLSAMKSVTSQHLAAVQERIRQEHPNGRGSRRWMDNTLFTLFFTRSRCTFFAAWLTPQGHRQINIQVPFLQIAIWDPRYNHRVPEAVPVTGGEAVEHHIKEFLASISRMLEENAAFAATLDKTEPLYSKSPTNGELP